MLLIIKDLKDEIKTIFDIKDNSVRNVEDRYDAYIQTLLNGNKSMNASIKAYAENSFHDWLTKEGFEEIKDWETWK